MDFMKYGCVYFCTNLFKNLPTGRPTRIDITLHYPQTMFNTLLVPFRNAALFMVDNSLEEA